MTKRILLLDMDTPCFASSSVIEKRSVEVLHLPTNKTKVFKTRTEFKERLKEKDALDKLNDYSFKDIQEPEPVENACYILKNMVKQIQTNTQADESLFFISGKNNFRDYLELPTRYKSSRSDTIRPLLLGEVREFAKNKYKPEICDFDEADDRIIYRAYELLDKGYYPIVSTIDKDARAYSGINLYNQDKPEEGIVTIPSMGSLYTDSKNKVRGNGFLWYCFQMLVGDTTDSYKPTEIAGVKYGDKSAYKLLNGCTTTHEALNKVLMQYKQWYPEPVTYKAWDGKEFTKNWFEMASLYHKCVRMKEHEFDELNFIDFCRRFDTEVNL